MDQISRYVDNGKGLLVPNDGLIVHGKYTGQLIRDGKIIDEFEDHNLVVNEGLNSLLYIYFHGSTQITTWYMGVFEANYTPVSTVTAATIASASTECTAYASATL